MCGQLDANSIVGTSGVWPDPDDEPEFGDVSVPVSAAIRSSTSWGAAKRRILVKFDIPMSR
jgi:hypothetical protein